MKYNENDKIVCIYIGTISGGYCVDNIKVNEIYTVDIDTGDCGIRVKEVNEHYYDKSRFLSLNEYNISKRKEKINKLFRI